MFGELPTKLEAAGIFKFGSASVGCGCAEDAVRTPRHIGDFEHESKPKDPLAGEGDGLGLLFNAKSCKARRGLPCSAPVGAEGLGTTD